MDMTQISSTDLLTIRSMSVTASDYAGFCKANTERLVQAYLDSQIEIVQLRKLIDEAADDIADWGSYASEYFREKHDLAGCVAKYRLRKEQAA